MNQINRKLVAIVFTDIVGFSKLSSEDQTKASGLKNRESCFNPLNNSMVIGSKKQAMAF